MMRGMFLVIITFISELRYDALKRPEPSMPLPNLHCQRINLCPHLIESILDEFPPLHQEDYKVSIILLDVGYFGRIGSCPQAIEDIKSIRIAILQINIVSLSVVRGQGQESPAEGRSPPLVPVLL